jgi:hypothetical protein
MTPILGRARQPSWVDQPSGTVTHLVIGGGKQGNLFLLNRDNMGKFSGSTNNVVQTINAGNGIFATPVFWQNNLYVAPLGALKQYVFNPATGKFNGAPSSQTAAAFGFPGATPSLSSNGTAGGPGGSRGEIYGAYRGQWQGVSRNPRQ